MSIHQNHSQHTTPPLLRLPVELRVQIYSHILSFPHPLKLRQHIPGSPLTSILRTNRQIHTEAISVLHDLNTISATRNDFCPNTDPALKTPIPTQHVRHLQITQFGESIACTYADVRCAVCEVSARGFVGVLAREMPKLRSVRVDFASQRQGFERFRKGSLFTGAHRSLSTRARGGAGSEQRHFKIESFAIGRWRLTGPGLEHLDFVFEHASLARVWPDVLALANLFPTPDRRDEVLDFLRKTGPEVTNKAYYFVQLRQRAEGARRMGVEDDGGPLLVGDAVLAEWDPERGLGEGGEDASEERARVADGVLDIGFYPPWNVRRET